MKIVGEAPNGPAGSGWERDTPSLKWWQGSDGYWYPPAPRAAGPTAMAMGPHAAPPVGRGGDGTPPSSAPRPATPRPYGVSPGEAEAARRAALRGATGAGAGIGTGLRTGAPDDDDPDVDDDPWDEPEAGWFGTPDAPEPTERHRTVPGWACVLLPVLLAVLVFAAFALLTAPTGKSDRVLTGGDGSAQGTSTSRRPRDARPTTTVPAATVAAGPTTTAARPTTTAAPRDDAPPTTEGRPEPTVPAPSVNPQPAPAAPAPEAAEPQPATPPLLVLPLLEPANEGRSCHRSYVPCVPVADDVDCEGTGDGPEYTGRAVVIGADEYELDTDGDGTACE